MRLFTPVVLTSLFVPACQDKSDPPGTSAATDTETGATTTIPVTEATLATTMTGGSEPATEPTTGTVPDTTGGGVPWGPVECDGVMCKEGEVCHDPSDMCVSYEPEDSESCPEYGCYESETFTPVCAAVPVECLDAPNIGECILDELCGDDGCFGNYFDAGKADCSPKYCHCP